MSEKQQFPFSKEVILGGLIISIFLCISVILVKVVSIQYIPYTNNGQDDVLITPYITATSMGNILELNNSNQQSLPGVFRLEMLVLVKGTGHVGLRMRKNPGINEEILFLADEGETLKIIDGPNMIDNQIWWGLISIDNPQKSGWSVQDYLEPQD